MINNKLYLNDDFVICLFKIERAECILNEQKILIEKKEDNHNLVAKKSAEFYKCLNVRKTDAKIINNKKTVTISLD